LNLLDTESTRIKISFGLKDYDDRYCEHVFVNVFDSRESYPGSPIFTKEFNSLKTDTELLLPQAIDTPYLISFGGCGGSASWLFEPELLLAPYRWQFGKDGLVLYQNLIRHENEIGSDALRIRESEFCDVNKYSFAVNVNGTTKESKFRKCRDGCLLKLSEDFEKGTKFIISINDQATSGKPSGRLYNTYVIRTEQVTLLNGC
jgi:hypothetical protein